MGGKELFPEEILPKDGVLKACAKEGRDCGTWVAMEGWLTDMDGNGNGGMRERRGGYEEEEEREMKVENVERENQ